MTSELEIVKSTVEEFDLMVQKCSAVLSKDGMRSIQDSLTVMQGIQHLKEFFKKPEIKTLVEAAQDNGFRGIIYNHIDSGRVFKSANIASLAADNPALHIIAGQRDR